MKKILFTLLALSLFLEARAASPILNLRAANQIARSSSKEQKLNCRSKEINVLLTPQTGARFSLMGGGRFQNQATAEVRVIYLVPSDRQPRAEFPAALTNAVKNLQGWYSDNLSGKSFTLHDPVVEIKQSTRDTNWFLTNSTGNNPSLNLWFNSVADA